MVGCEDWNHFKIVIDPETEEVLTLESTDDDQVGFMVVDPFVIVPDYEFRISDSAELQISIQLTSRVLAMLTVRTEPFQVTANLMGPLVLNIKNSIGKQLVLAESTYSVHHPVAFGVEEPVAGDNL